MSSRLIARLICSACLGLVPAVGACAASSPYMAETTVARPLEAPADKAVVVFLRPSGMGFAINISILDQQGNWVGDAVAKTHFATTLAPGEYMFVGWAENTAALKATLAPGRVYYVAVNPQIGLGSQRVTLEALTPRHADWQRVPTWLQETRRLEPLSTGADYIRSRQGDALKRVASARENWGEYSEQEKQARTLLAEDGVPSGGKHNDVAAAAPVSCTSDVQCPADLLCIQKRCARVVKAAPAAAAGCTKDTECTGDLVCVRGACVAAPPPVPEPAASASAASPAAIPCTKDTECPGDQVCAQRTCKPPAGSPPATPASSASAAPPVPAPVTSAAPRKCARNADCSNDQYCSKGQCLPVPAAAQTSCKKTADCPADTLCEKGRCTPANTSR